MNLLNLIVSNSIELTHFIGNAQREGHALMPMTINYAYKNMTTGEIFVIEFEHFNIKKHLEPCQLITN